MSLRNVLLRTIQLGAAIGALAVGNPFLAAGILLGGQMLASKLRGGSTSGGAGVAQKQTSLTLNISSPEAALPVVYGYALIGTSGVDIRLDAADTKSMAVVGALCIASEAGGGIEAIEEVRFDGVLAINGATFEGEPRTTNIQGPWVGAANYGVDGWLQYGAHAGTDAQAVDAELDTKFGDWGTNDKGGGIAYLALWFYYNSDIYPHGIPQVTAKVKGNKVFDPRDSSTAWSDNPVLHIRDWLTSKKYGLRIPTASIDDTSFTAAANYADELVTNPDGGTQKRFIGGGAFLTNDDPLSVLEELKSACRAQVVRIGGKYTIHIRQVQTAETFELTEDNILGEFEFYRGGVGQVPNQMAVTYVDADRKFQADDILWPAPGATNNFLTADNSFINQHQIDLPATDQRYRAQQIGMTLLKELRSDLGVALTANREALKLQHGDVVKVSHSTPGWSQKEFWVVGVGITPEHNVRLLLREYESTVYTIDTQDTTDPAPGTDLPDPNTIAAPTSVTATSDGTTALDTQDGQRVPRIKLAWTAPTDPFLGHFNIRFKVTADSAFTAAPNADGDDTIIFIWPVTDGVGYTVEVRSVNTAGSASAWVSATVTVDTTPVVRLSDVRGFPDVPSTGQVTVRWTRNSGTFAVWAYVKTLPLPVDDADGPWPDDTTPPTAVLPVGTDFIVVAEPAAGSITFLQLEPRASDGTPGPLVRIMVDPAAVTVEIEAPAWAITAETESGSTGSFSVQLFDDDAVMDDVYYRTKSGTGAWGSYTLQTASPSDLDTYTRTVTMIEDHHSFVEFRGRYTINDVQRTVLIKSSGFDLGNIANVTGIGITFDEEAQAVVSATGDSDTVNMYVTVGDGSAPSDPTVATNDGTISGRTGSVTTGVKVTTGNDAFVKVVGANAAAALGVVQSAKVRRELGPFHKDATSRTHTGDTNLTTLQTITIPANKLGTNGGVRVTASFKRAGGPAAGITLKWTFGGAALDQIGVSTSVTQVDYNFIIVNRGATNLQNAHGFLLAKVVGHVSIQAAMAIDTTSDVDLVFAVTLGDAADDAELEFTMAEYIGRD